MHRSEVPIAKPCWLAADWASLSGDERKRFCGQCSRDVYDLSAMSEDEARQLVSTRHVCIRYTVDSSGRLLHGVRTSVLALGAALATSAQAAPAVAPPAAEDQGWLSWLTERTWSWWSPPAEEATLPPLTRPAPRSVSPDTVIVPHEVLGGVPPEPPPMVSVEDQTGRPHTWLESSCCGRSRFVDGKASIAVEDPGFIELVGDPSTKIQVRPGERVVCEDFQGNAWCRVDR